jgi:integrase/recombinase XerD
MMKTPESVENYLGYLETVRRRNRSTLMFYRKDLLQYCEFLAGHAAASRPLETSGLSLLPEANICGLILQATAKTAEAFRDALKQKSFASATIARKCAAVEGFYRYLAKTGQIVKNPFYELSLERSKSRQRTCLDDSQVNQFIESIPMDCWLGFRDRAITAILYTTGVKIGDLSNLSVTDYYPADRSLHIRKSGGKTRAVRLSDRTAAILDEYLAHRLSALQHCPNPIDTLFLNRESGSLSVRSIRRKLEHYRHSAGLSFSITPEILRHSCAVQMLRHGVSLENLAGALGYLSVGALKQQMELNESAALVTEPQK